MAREGATACEPRVHDTPAPAASPSSAIHGRRVALIAAVARNGVIGASNTLPWHLPEDLNRFRTLTSGHTVVMGRKTWESIGKPLPNRQNIVVSRQAGLCLAGASVAHSLEEALAFAVMPDPVFVIGGEALYRSALPFAAVLHLTEIERDFHGDARFPAFDRAAWREIAREVREPANGEGFAYHFATYERAPA
jgi:dihydrofolate reductase